MIVRRTLLCGVLCFVCAAPSFSQVSTRLLSAEPAEAKAGEPVIIVAEIREAATVSSVTLAYRPFGESQYHLVEMDLVGNRAGATLPATAAVPPFIEYYIVIRDQSGTLDVYPQAEGPDPFTNPPGITKRILVADTLPSESHIVFLSPDPSSVLLPDDLVISLSLLRVDSLIDRAYTRILLDGSEITQNVIFSGDLVVYVPANAGVLLPPGLHTVTVMLFDRQNNLAATGSLSFSVLGEGMSVSAEVPSRPLLFSGSANVESRRENVSEHTQWYNRASVQVRGTYGDIRTVGNLFITSDESQNRQPQNRYYLSVEVPWLSLEAGDAYPAFPDLILSSKRIRGVTSSLKLGFFHVDATYGSVNRAIEGTVISTFPVDSLSREQAADPTASYSDIGGGYWGKGVPGTYARTLFALRPSFGSPESFQWGFTWLNAKDDPSSIRFGIRPKENIVLGTDLIARFDNGRVELGLQGAFSAFNSDISSGSFTDAYIDSVYPEQAGDIRTLRDLLGNYITVNDNFRPLSLDYPATIAAEGRLAANYFDHYLRLTYLYRGADYTSFGQSYLRTDIQGVNASDRFRLFQNNVFATVGFERLSDNTARTKPSTTVFTTLNAAISYYPTTDFPGLTLGYARYSNENDIAPDSLLSISDVTNRLSLQSFYTFEWGTTHTLLLNLSSSVRTDHTKAAQNVNNFVTVIGLTTRYRIPLQTEVSIGVNLNELPGATPATSSRLDYTSLNFTARYVAVPKILTLIGTIGPTFGDFARTTLDARAEWAFLDPMMLLFQASYFNNRGIPNDTFVSLRFLYTY